VRQRALLVERGDHDPDVRRRHGVHDTKPGPW
jgi:hypothetical protein